MGKFDLPASIDYIRDITGQDKISYVGHSQGTASMFAALGQNHGDMKNKINLFIALAPVAYLGNTKLDILKTLSGNINHLNVSLKILHINALFGPEWPLISDSLIDLEPEFAEQSNQIMEFNRQPHWGDIGVDDLY